MCIKLANFPGFAVYPQKHCAIMKAKAFYPPDRVDRFTGYRYYTGASLSLCSKIIALKELGFSLQEIKAQLAANSEEGILKHLRQKRAQLEGEIARAHSRISRLNAAEEQLTEGIKNMFHPIFKEGEVMAVSLHRKIYASAEEARAESISMQKTTHGKNTRRVIVHYETEHKESNLDMGAAVELAAGKSAAHYQDSKLKLFPKTASLICKAGEEAAALRALARFIENAPAQLVGPVYEVHYGDGTVELKAPVCPLSQGAQSQPFPAPEGFVNDEAAVGKWNLLDIVPSREQFLYGHPKCTHGAWLTNLYFLPEGQGYWVIAGWYKGKLFTQTGFPPARHANSYTIETEATTGKKLLFLQMHDARLAPLGGLPEIWVYEKVSDKAFTPEEISLRDKVDLPFVADRHVTGPWRVYDFLQKKEDFQPGKQVTPAGQLFFTRISFSEEGNAVMETQSHTAALSWTKGFLLNKRQHLAPAYEITQAEGREYLFIEWKSGDYMYGGGRVSWYVFVRG